MLEEICYGALLKGGPIFIGYIGIDDLPFDVRGKPLQQARHWSAPEIFGPRAHFNTDTDPATLDIQKHPY
uniref:Uncharacterized protein n=1 Tax=Anopheles epiroticus TaxID=199890 RepID=A0A182PQZ4_9DIPT